MVSLEYQRVHTVYLGTITFNEWNASAVGPKVHKFQFKCIPEKSYIIFTLLYSLVHENGGYWYVLADKGVFWRAMAYLGGEHAVTRHCPPKPVSLGTQVNPWRAMACNPPFPAIARPYPPVWELRLKLKNEFGRIPPSSATLVAVNGGPEYNEY